MTLNGVMTIILLSSIEFRSFGADYIKVTAEDRPVQSATEM